MSSPRKLACSSVIVAESRLVCPPLRVAIGSSAIAVAVADLSLRFRALLVIDLAPVLRSAGVVLRSRVTTIPSRGCLSNTGFRLIVIARHVRWDDLSSQETWDA